MTSHGTDTEVNVTLEDGMRKNQVSIQLYTLRAMAQDDLDGTLAEVARIGYPAVELAGLQGHTASDVRAMLDKHGLKASSAHIPLIDFESDIEGVVDTLRTLGAGWGIVPAVSEAQRTVEVAPALAEAFNTYAVRLQGSGLNFAYHNHAFEFTETDADGRTLFDLLVKGTDATLVKFELDAFWTAVGGYDPAEIIRAYGSRICLLHLKDAAADDKARDVPFGAGTMDWDSILSASRDAGVEWYITEQDNPNPDDPLGDVTTALNNANEAAR